MSVLLIWINFSEIKYLCWSLSQEFALFGIHFKRLFFFVAFVIVMYYIHLSRHSCMNANKSRTMLSELFFKSLNSFI